MGKSFNEWWHYWMPRLVSGDEQDDRAIAEAAWHAALAAAPPAPAAEPVAVPEGWILVPEHPTDTQVLKLMNVGLRHAEYKEGTGGPTVDEMRQGMAYALQAGPEPPAPPPVEASQQTSTPGAQEPEWTRWQYQRKDGTWSQFMDERHYQNTRDSDGWNMRRIVRVMESSQQQQCPCGDREASKCPGEWEPGCDLGANEAHARRVDEAIQQQNFRLRSLQQALDVSGIYPQSAQGFQGAYSERSEWMNGWNDAMMWAQRMLGLIEQGKTAAEADEMLDGRAEFSPPSQQQAEPAVSEYIRKLVGRIDYYRLRMSYNESYFGEPAGLLKGVVSELARVVNAIYPSGETCLYGNALPAAAPNSDGSCESLNERRTDETSQQGGEVSDAQ